MDEFDVDLTIFGGADMSVPIAAVRGRITRPSVSGPILLDHFTDADGTDLTAHTMDVGPGWERLVTSYPGLNNPLQISGNKAGVAPLIVGDGCYVSESGRADVTISVTFQLPDVTANNYVGVICRCSDGNHMWMCIWQGNGTITLYEVDTLTFTSRASAVWTADLAVHTAKLVCSGTTITAYLDGVQVCQYASATYQQTATKHGLRLCEDPSNRDTLADDFTVTA